MLTEYNCEIFNTEIKDNKVNIWKYVPVAEFQKTIITTFPGWKPSCFSRWEESPFFYVKLCKILQFFLNLSYY